MIAGMWLAVLFGLGWIPLFWFRTQTYTEVRGLFQGTERRWTTAAPWILGGHTTMACFALNFIELSPERFAASAAVFGFAVAFWFWGRQLISPLQVRTRPDEPPLEFHRDGAFAIVRHPLFFSYLVATFAPLIAVPHLFLFATYGLCARVLVVLAREEERRLHQQLGPIYAAYCSQVARLIPFVW